MPISLLLIRSRKRRLQLSLEVASSSPSQLSLLASSLERRLYTVPTRTQLPRLSWVFFLLFYSCFIFKSTDRITPSDYGRFTEFNSRMRFVSTTRMFLPSSWLQQSKDSSRSLIGETLPSKRRFKLCIREPNWLWVHLLFLVWPLAMDDGWSNEYYRDRSLVSITKSTEEERSNPVSRSSR